MIFLEMTRNNVDDIGDSTHSLHIFYFANESAMCHALISDHNTKHIFAYTQCDKWMTVVVSWYDQSKFDIIFPIYVYLSCNQKLITNQ